MQQLSYKLSNILPAPRHSYSTISISTNNYAPNNSYHIKEIAIARLNACVPPYGERESSNYIPREPKDFGDGGAFPELPYKQFPLDMGRTDTMQHSSSKVVAIRTDADGNIQYDAILREGMRKEQILHSKYEDLAPKDDILEEELLIPSPESIAKQTAKTKQALEKITNCKLSATGAAYIGRSSSSSNKPIFIRYTSSKVKNGKENKYASGSKSRMIKLYEVAVDPMEPPKFKHSKLPIRPPSPPVPIMHSPPRRVTVEDQKNWKIPPCTSNWKNPRGYTLPLHQRLAADGRSLQNHVINDGFARFSEALLIAERQARKEVEARAQMRALMAKKKKMETEKQLAMMAKNIKNSDMNDTQNTNVEHSPSESSVNSSESDSGVDEEQIKAREERDRLRKERVRDNKREYRMSKKKNNLSIRQRERDISEKIALGQLNGKKSMDGIYDRRLFNQQSGLQSGFNADDTYNLYDQPLFNAKNQRIYRPKEIIDYEIYDHAQLMKPHRMFKDSKNDESKDKKISGFEFEMDTNDTQLEYERMPKRKRKREEMEDDLSKLVNERIIDKSEDKRRKLNDMIGNHSHGYMYASGGSALLMHGREKRYDVNDTRVVDDDDRRGKKGNEYQHIWKRGRIAFEEGNDHLNDVKEKQGIYYPPKHHSHHRNREQRRDRDMDERRNRYRKRDDYRYEDKYQHRSRNKRRRDDDDDDGNRGRWGDDLKQN